MKKRWNNSTTFEKIMIVMGLTIGSPLFICLAALAFMILLIASVFDAFDFIFGGEGSKDD